MFDRYLRQIKLENFNELGQKNLFNSHILLVGAGGVASGLLPLLVSSGIGKISIFDADKVSLTNLHRQTLFKESQIGKSKSESAKLNFKALNSDVKIESYEQFFDYDEVSINALKSANLCIDASDSFKSRLLVSKLCKQNKIPEIMAAAQGYVSQVTVFADNFYLDNMLCDKNAQNEKAQGLPIFPPSAHLSGVIAAAYSIKKLARAETFEAGKFMSFNFETFKYYSTKLSV